jgi:CubicO group peptidase (beta-lactamase class C family)
MQTNLEKRASSELDFGIDDGRLQLLFSRIGEDVAAGVYPGAAFAMARGGRIVAERVFGTARLASEKGPAIEAKNDTLWLLYSQTKPITSCAIWILAERGLINLHHPVAYYIPGFARLGKQDLTTFHCLTHQAGFPNANVSEDVWQDHGLLNEAVSNFALDYAPGEKVFYHSYAAHWVQAALIEAITGEDFRKFIADEIVAPLNLKNLFVGVPAEEHGRLAGSYVCAGDGSGGTSEFGARTTGGVHHASQEFDNTAFHLAGVPGAGGYATAGDVAMFYQMLIGLGVLNGRRILSSRMVQYATTNQTGDRPDEFFGIPMHRALGVHVRGYTPSMRGLSSIAHPDTFGHGGVGTSYSFADPGSGVSCTYLTNSRLSEPWHSKRLDEIMTMAQAAIVRL